MRPPYLIAWISVVVILAALGGWTMIDHGPPVLGLNRLQVGDSKAMRLSQTRVAFRRDPVLGRPVPELVTGGGVLEVPRPIADFDAWLTRYRAAQPQDRGRLLAEGKSLLAARRAAMSDLIISDPKAAILLSPSPSARALLPAEYLDQLERIVAGEGFYGVKAVCNHDPAVGHAAGCRIEHEAVLEGLVYKASIYGDRKGRLTEEKASLYGVVLDGKIALAEDDFVVLPAGDVTADPARTGQLAVTFKGQTTYVPNEAALSAHIQKLLAR